MKIQWFREIFLLASTGRERERERCLNQWLRLEKRKSNGLEKIGAWSAPIHFGAPQPD